MNCLPTKYLNPANLRGSLEKKEKKNLLETEYGISQP